MTLCSNYLFCQCLGSLHVLNPNPRHTTQPTPNHLKSPIQRYSCHNRRDRPNPKVKNLAHQCVKNEAENAACAGDDQAHGGDDCHLLLLSLLDIVF